MKKEFVPYQQSLELKELGFDEPCLASWNFYTNDFYYNGIPSTFTSEHVIQLPTFSQAFGWFREKYELYPYIETAIFVDDNSIVKYDYVILVDDNSPTEVYNNLPCDEFEDAELECLKKLIEIVKQKQ